MPKKISQTEHNEILRVIKEHPDEISTPEIQAALSFPLTTRTLQRRLADLVSTGKIICIGSRPKRYLCLTSYYTTPVAPPPILEEDAPAYMTFSPEAREIHALIERPTSERTRVGYQPEFLTSYIPNVTSYLDDDTKSKLRRIGNVGLQDAPAGTYIRDILDRLLIDLSWNSSRLEGNTYSLLETQQLLAHGEIATGKNVRETQMILNHKEAIELLADQGDEIGFNPYTICNLHALLSNNLLSDSSACGSIRLRAVGISGCVYTPLAVPQQLDEYFQLILTKAAAIRDPFEQAFFVMVHLPYLQPFEDVNKRVSRLSANISLIQHNLCPLSFIDVPQEDYVKGLLGVYELNRYEALRDVFVWAYTRSAQQFPIVKESLGEPDPFRLTHRNLIKQLIRDHITNGKAPIAPSTLTAEEARTFHSIIETELASLHIGNIARYGIRPSEFTVWQGSRR